MNTQKMQLVGLVLAMGLSSVAQAEVFTNDVVADTPFSVTVDTDALVTSLPGIQLVTQYGPPMVSPIAYDYTDTWGDNYVTTPLSTTTIITPPQIGVDGSADTYNTDKLTYDLHTTRTQGYDVTAIAFGGTPDGLTGSQIFLISGQIENLIGANLLNGGNAEAWVQLGVNWNPLGYGSITGESSNTLSFKTGSSLGQMDNIVFSEVGNPLWTSFSGYPDPETGINIIVPTTDYISFNLNLSGTTYFEAEFSLTGAPDMQIVLPTFYLRTSGGIVETSPVVLPMEETYTYLASSEVLPALPVPEPEAYAMMLAGLGLVGWAARRRKS